MMFKNIKTSFIFILALLLSLVSVSAINQDETLVGWYPLTDNGTDISWSENGGTNTGVTFSGTEVSFDGINDYIDTSYDSRTDVSTYSFWVKSTSTTDGVLMGVDGNDRLQLSQNFGSVDGKFRFYTKQGNVIKTKAYFTEASFNDGNWHHFLLINDISDGSLKVYFDGGSSVVSYDDQVAGTSHTLSGSIYLGANNNLPTANVFVDGELKDFSIFNKDFTSGEVTELFTNGITLVDFSLLDTAKSYWTFDNTLVDETGNGFDLTNTGATYTATGYLNGAYNYDGSTDYMSYTGDTLTSDITISAWIKRDTTSDNDMIYEKHNSGSGYGISFSVTSSDTIQFCRSTTGADYGCMTSTATITDNNFHHVIATYDGVENKIYIDGKLDTTDTILTGNLFANTDTAYVGKRGWAGGLNFDGVIDELGIWDFALTENQVKSFYTLEERLALGLLEFTQQEFYNGAVTATKTIEADGKLFTAYVKSGSGTYLTICELEGINCVPEISISSSGGGTVDMFDDGTGIVIGTRFNTKGYYHRFEYDGTLDYGFKLFNNFDTGYISMVKFDATDFIIAFQDTGDGSRGKYTICKLDGSGCGAEIVTYSSAVTDTKIIKDSEGKFHIGEFRVATNTYQINRFDSAMVYDGTNIQVNTGSVSSYVNFKEGSDNKIKITYRDEGNSYQGTFMDCNLDSTGCSSEITFSTDNSKDMSSIIEYNNNIYFSYRDDVGADLKLIKMNLDGTNIVSQTIDSDINTVSDLILTSTNRFIISFNDFTNSKGMFAISELFVTAPIITIDTPTDSLTFTYDLENTPLQVTTDVASTCVFDDGTGNVSLTTADNLVHTFASYNMGVATTSVKQFDLTYSCTDTSTLEIGVKDTTFYQDQIPLALEIFVPQDQQSFDYDTQLITFHIETNYQSDCEYLVFNMSAPQAFTNTGASVHTTDYTTFYPDINAYHTSFTCDGTIVAETVELNVTFYIDEQGGISSNAIQKIDETATGFFGVLKTIVSEVVNLITGNIFSLILAGLVMIFITTIFIILQSYISSIMKGGKLK